MGSGREQSGQVLVLLLGLTIVVFAVVGLAVDGTKAFLMQRSLQNAADAAAVSAAASIDRRTYYSSGGMVIEIHERVATAAAASILERRGLPAMVKFGSDDQAVEIAVTSRVQTTFLRLVGIDEIDVAATAAAEPFAQVVPNVP